MVAQSWAIVTGANRGLGYEVAKKLAAEGHSVVLTARDVASGEKAAAAIVEASPGSKVAVLQLDAGSPASIEAFASQVAEHYPGKVDLLVNNAGIFLDGWDAESLEATLRTNLDGALGTTLALLPQLAEGARVVMVASGLGKLGNLTPDYAEPIKAAATLEEVKKAAHIFLPDSEMPRHNTHSAQYSISKAALIRSAQILSEDPAFTSKGVSVVAVCPGWCATDMGSSATAKTGVAPPRTAGQGGDSIVMAADAKAVPNGSFSTDGEVEDWTGSFVNPAAVST